MALLSFVGTSLTYWLLECRGEVQLAGAARSRVLGGGALLFAGWLLHYAPFFVMERQLFLHHYLPAAAFKQLLIGLVVEHLCERLRAPAVTRTAVAVAVVVALAAAFVALAPLTYGLDTSPAHAERLRWRPTWDIKVSF